MVYDTRRARMVVFGGSFASETWEYDGLDWSQRTPATPPATRAAAAMAYDEARGVSVLFGGLWLGVVMGDTWEWDGTNWVAASYPGAPPARSHHSMVFDAARARIMMRGGGPVSGNPDDTWIWDGISWSTLPGPVPTTSFRFEPMVYDRDRGTVLHLSPGAIAAESITRVWSANGWDSHGAPATGTALPYRHSYSAAYDPVRRRAWLFGGRTDHSTYGDLWEWDGTAASNLLPHGPGCPGPAGTPTLEMDHPRLGGGWFVSLTGPYPATAFVFGLGDTTWGPIPLPAPLASLGMPGCSLNLAPESWCLVAPTSGVAAYMINATATQGLSPFTAYCQALCFSPGANTFGAVVSDSVRVLVGRY
ncbi:MAG: hypothetical protein IPK26_25685 [Planctomycetes bacterium]|nr:hypothetical protein [Planctomycetota bacterium]